MRRPWPSCVNVYKSTFSITNILQHYRVETLSVIVAAAVRLWAFYCYVAPIYCTKRIWKWTLPHLAEFLHDMSDD